MFIFLSTRLWFVPKTLFSNFWLPYFTYQDRNGFQTWPQNLYQLSKLNHQLCSRKWGDIILHNFHSIETWVVHASTEVRGCFIISFRVHNIFFMSHSLYSFRVVISSFKGSLMGLYYFSSDDISYIKSGNYRFQRF